ncbi:hypothetical protein EIH07_00685 [Chryseobacterium taklimakanense]|uniref:M14 family zinc carboxypeptidase n=1 Tax=Chryseobacterium taklimakanense TaxID=536441 RepID=UPI000F5F6983|nr:M14 family zinc carboxypeptidase [Chryseobacterium taklimakanense]AZI21659.1 hypothetical protein EIH07_00685 [Chryseobacterium taklimakanense]
MKKILFLLLVSQLTFAQNHKTPYEKGNGNQTPTYEEMVRFYNELDAKHQSICIKTYGLTDSGEPLKVIFFSNDGKFDKNKSVILINNGIHPGEPDGIDASMMMLRNFAEGKLKAPKNLIIAVMESYNIGGMMNRGKYSRANQNGPEEHGFRGNARNYDLNRDFIKTDSRNAMSFQEMFHDVNPIYFIDNHVSNGADYQYTFTYINTNKERLGKILGSFKNDEMSPKIKENLLKKGIISTPYVEINGLKPELGYETFMDSPRYATGYTSLFNTLGEVPETHMLKPYKDRVKVTYENMLSTIEYLDDNISKIKDLRQKNLVQYQPGMKYGIQWKIDSTKTKTIEFRGYEAGMKPSEISGKPRLFYDRNKPYTKKIPFYDTYTATKEITIPRYYVVPQSEWQVLAHLKRNQIEMKPLKKDSTITVEQYKIADFKTYQRPYEGHYAHYDTKVSASAEIVKFRKGDFLISVNQKGVKYLLETLEPEAVDSFFNWNLFDSILGQKEYYSDYVFEDTGAEILENNPKLREGLEKKKAEDQKFAEDGRAQLDWVYRNSEYYEKTHMRYPIFRIL